ncbi:U3 snoRNP protein [Geranomyces variabilis]|uniref:U3 snoRNP protein n=1 Tax=Geranomyces variabilis TaxID=109894 RepID=A0AAD5TGJ1_9FUNG|nr:U3 snoRNP protein [Geranomyces variabilis]
MGDHTVKALNTTEGTNRFRFQAQSERVQSVNIDVTRRVRRAWEAEEPEHGSYLIEGLDRWQEINCTGPFTLFVREVRPYAMSLVMILQQKDTIVAILLKHLAEPSRVAVEPLLDLTASLARDLQEELYPYFPRICSATLQLLENTELRIAELVFKTLAYLYKHLAAQLKDDIVPTFDLISPFLSHSTSYIRRFSAEAFGSLLRILSRNSTEAIYIHIVDAARTSDNDSTAEAVGWLFLESFKQVQEKIHSRAPAVLRTLFKVALDNDREGRDKASRVIEELFDMLIAHASSESLQPLWEVLLNELDSEAQICGLQAVATGTWKMEKLLKLADIWLNYGNGDKVEDQASLFQCVNTLLPNLSAPLEQSVSLQTAFSSFLAKLFLMSASYSDVTTRCKPILDALFASNDAVFVLSFLERLRCESWQYFPHMVVPGLLGYMPRMWTAYEKHFVLFMATLFENNIEQYMHAIPHSSKTNINLLRFPKKQSEHEVDVIQCLIDRIQASHNWEQLAGELSQSGATSGLDIGTIAAICSSIPYLACPHDSLLAALQSIFRSLCVRLDEKIARKTGDDVFGVVISLTGFILTTLTKCASRMRSTAGVKDVTQLVQESVIPHVGINVVALSGVADWFEFLRATEPAHSALTVETLDGVLPILVTNVGSVIGAVRKHTLRILNSFHQHNLRPVQESIFKGPCHLFELLLTMECTADTVATSREKALLLRRLDSLVESKTLPEIYAQVPTRYVLALFSIQFTPLWAEATKSLHLYGEKAVASFWPVFKESLISTGRETKISPEDIGETNGKSLETLLDEAEADSDAMDVDGDRQLEASTSLFANVEQSLVKHLRSIITAEIPSFDMAKYHSLMIRLLAGLPQIIANQSTDIVPLFLQLFNDETTHLNMMLTTDGMGLDSPQPENLVETASELNFSIEIREGARPQVVEFLAAFAKLRRPQRVFRAAVVYNIYLQLLCKGDDRLQQLAFEGIVGWRLPDMDYMADSLKRLTVDDTFRDALSTLSMSEIEANVQAQYRPPLMDVLVRILYGKLISRRGRASASGLAARRAAIFAFFTGVDEDVLANMIKLAILPFGVILRQPDVDASGHLRVDLSLPESALGSLKRQNGFLHVCEDLIKQLRSLLIPFLPQILKVVIYIIQRADAQPADSHAAVEGFASKQQKEARSLGIRRIKELFEANLEFDFTPYVPAIFKAFVAKRIPSFAEENTQGTSAILELFMAWAKDRRYAAYLVDYSPDLVPNVVSVLSGTKVKPAVTTSVLTLIESILELEGDSLQENLVAKVLRPYVQVLLTNLNAVLANTFAERGSVVLVGNTVPARVVRILARLSVYVTDGESASRLLDMMLPYTKRPATGVPETIKLEIIQILNNFLPILPALKGCSPVDTPYYSLTSYLFGILETRDARVALIDVFARFATMVDRLLIVSEILHELNSYSTARMDEPDFNRRFATFAKINQELYLTLTPIQWLPVLHNLLFFVQERDEFSIRTSASFGISQFITKVAALPPPDDESMGDAVSKEFLKLITNVVLPAIKRGVKLNSIVVRSEFVNLLGQLVSSFPALRMVSDMRGLLADGDDEASFFANIYHLQIHRRVRALRRLAEECSKGTLSPANVSNIFVPIVAHFIFESDRISDHNLINDAVTTIAACGSALNWGQYWALFKRILNAMTQRPELEKVLNRVIISLLDGFHFAMSVAVDHEEPIIAEPAAQATADEVTPLLEDELVDEAEDAADELPAEEEAPQKPAAPGTRVHAIVINKLLPTLQTYVEKVDDNTLPVRIPLALAIAKLLQRLPAVSMKVPLAKLITTMCNFLRSRGQDARDCTRDTLVKISVLLGPAFFPFILKELEGALTRGYQLHVLGFTVHSILMNLVPALKPGDLDPCVDQVVKVCVADIFGEAGAEREVLELRGKMREIKTTKSFDSLELISKAISFHQTSRMLLPLKEIMLETSSAAVTRKIEDIFRRLALGLNTNASMEERELMVFVYELITENLPLSQATAPEKKKKSNAEKNFTVQLKRNGAVEPLRYFQANAHMFIDFGLSLLVTALRSQKIGLRNPEHLAMLDPMVELLGRSLYSKHNSVATQALRVFCIIATAPLPKLKPTMPIVVRRLFEIIGKSQIANAELTKQAYRLLTIVIRDCKHVSVSEAQLVLVLNVIRPDLEAQETDRQGTAFSLIRAILARKVIVKEMYDLMELVARILVTSQSGQVRDLCRQAYMQFLLEYPQGPSKLKKQMTYFVKNLSYDHESGRDSVLQMLHSIIIKFSDDVLFEYSDLLFLSLVMTLVNDDIAKCRELAGTVIRALVSRLDAARFAKVVELVESWFGNSAQPQLQRTAAQVSGLILESASEREQKWIPTFLRLVAVALEPAAARLSDPDASDDNDAMAWETCYYSLNTFSKVIIEIPVVKCSPAAEPVWQLVLGLMLHPHQWIRSVCNKLLGLFFQSVDAKTREVVGAIGGTTMAGPRPLVATREDVKNLGTALATQLDSHLLTQDLATQILKNLIWVGKAMFELDTATSVVANDDDAEDEEEVEADDDEMEAAVQVKLAEKGGQQLLLALCRRLAFLCRADLAKKRGPLLRQSVFHFFAAIANAVPPETLPRYLFHMISTLYRTAKDETAKGEAADKLRLLAHEVLDHLRKVVGTQPYLETYNKVEQRILEVRRERRAARSVMAVADPEQRARRRIQKNEMKKGSRKRKAEEFSSKKIKMGISKKMRG